MTTERQRFSITLDDDLYNKVSSFRYNNRINTQTKAVVSLLQLGLKTLEADETANVISDNDLKIIKKYRALDKHGKEVVDFLLDKEYERSSSENKQPDEFGFTSEEDLIVIPTPYTKAK